MIEITDEKMWREPWDDPSRPIPKLSLSTLDLLCKQCGNHWVMPVPETFFDWKKEAEVQRRCADHVIKTYENIYDELTAQFPHVAVYLKERRKRQAAELRLMLCAAQRRLGIE